MLHSISDDVFRAKTAAAVMRATGCTEQEFLAMFRRAPCFVCMSAELLRHKVLLTYSLSKRLKARGVDVGNERLVTILRKPEARFMERYILRYSHQVPEFLDLYPPDHNN